MIKEIKYLLYIIIIILTIFFTGSYYFSDKNKKKSYRSLNNIDQKIYLYTEEITTLNNDTDGIIEYAKKAKKKKKYFFWDLIDKND